MGGGAEDKVSDPSSFITNAHNELYAFHTGKSDLQKKTLRPTGEATALTRKSNF